MPETTCKGFEPPDVESEVRAAQVRQLFARSDAGLTGALISAVVLAVALRNEVPHGWLLLWLAIYLVVQAPRYSLIWNFQRAIDGGTDLHPWGRRFSLLTIISGLIWGLSGVFLFPADSVAHQFLLAISVGGISSAAAVVYAPLTECYLPTITATLLPLSGRYLYERNEVDVIIGSVILIFWAVLAFTGRRMHEANLYSIRMGLRNNDLIRNLRAEIEERNRAERALVKTEERLELALNGANLCLWDWNIQKEELFVDPNWMQTLGYSKDEVQLHLGWWEQLLHPEDRCEITSAMDVHLTGCKPFYEAEHRLRSKAGDWRWVLSRGQVAERLRNGNPSRVIGTCVDITDRKLAEKQVRESLTEKEVLLREIHHRVNNNLQVMSSLLRLQSRYVHDERYREMFNESENRVQVMALVHEKLYQSQNLAEIKVHEYLLGLAKQICQSYEGGKGRISLKAEIQPLVVSIETAVPLGFIVLELVSNALKHAFPGEMPGEVSISLSQVNGSLELAISDNGIGVPENVTLEHPQTLGLRLVTLFVTQLHGETTIRRTGGTRVCISLKEVKRRETFGNDH